MRMRGIVLTTVLLLLASPGVAAAATARLEGGTLVFEAGAGEVNDVVVAYFTRRFPREPCRVPHRRGRADLLSPAGGHPLCRVPQPHEGPHTHRGVPWPTA